MNLARNEIFLLYSNGVSQAEIARSAGVTRQRINQIVGGPEYEAVRRRYEELVEQFDASRTTTRRTLRTVREDRAARKRDRAFRAAYLQAHPRARLTPVRAGGMTPVLDAPAAEVTTLSEKPALRLVV